MSYFFANDEINQEVKLSLEDALQNGDGVKYGYFIINKRNPNDIQIINNHPDWFETYLENLHQLSDPVVKMSLSRIEGFCWDEKITLSTQPDSIQGSRESQMMHEAREYNVMNGQTAIIHDYQNNLVLFSIYNLSSNPTVKRNMPNMEQQLFFI
ncbi:autoinducer binding domain-containing protein [Pantoea phytobeneficialis]|uniref:Autoinducer binding domain-containing protein n=1 Tax=Pantoea phytobeneficialis TaxID=2052056 RepID=A0AAP9KRX3_9GAMM|nr:autoinducer binding domain-containing protein [Pantoea phytobeneficialis]MDO6407474.1 autoinducer binding domain-containing protein [Pantoea phytobeneficialis]QGR09478.1 hypothetical protein CTZ24_23685 [Pantoea phytobeneficialis]